MTVFIPFSPSETLIIVLGMVSWLMLPVLAVMLRRGLHGGDA